MKAYIFQILGDTSLLEKEVLNESIRNILPKNTNFTFNIFELKSMDVKGNNIQAEILQQRNTMTIKELH